MKARIVSFRCILRNNLGQVLSSSFYRELLTGVGGASGMMAGLERGLEGAKRGEKRRIRLPASEAYGFYQPSQVHVVSRKSLQSADALKIGSQVLGKDEEGGTQFFRIMAFSRDQVTLDANHPLAGQDLTFEVEVTEARRATPAEVAAARPPRLLSH